MLVQQAVRAVVARESDARGLANIAYAAASAFARLGQLDVQLFTALARRAEHRVGDFIAQDLANTAWAFATGTHKDALLFRALVEPAVERGALQAAGPRQHSMGVCDGGPEE